MVSEFARKNEHDLEQKLNMHWSENMMRKQANTSEKKTTTIAGGCDINNKNIKENEREKIAHLGTSVRL